MPSADFLVAQRRAAPPYTAAPTAGGPLAALYDAWQASGLPLEEFKRRILQAAEPPVGPATIAPPYTAAPIEPPPSYIQQLQGAAFLAPPAGTPEVSAMQREGFNYDENAARAATGQRVIPEMPMGTPEGRAASKQALAGVIPMESVPTAERITEWDRLIAQQEGYKEAATAQGQYWEKGRPSEPSMMDKIGGVIKGAGLVGGAVEALPVVGPIAELAAQGVEATAPYTMPVIQKGLVNPVLRGLETWQEEVVEHKAGALITFGQGIREGDIGMMAKAWGMTPKEGKKAYHESSMPVQMVASVVADPLTWVGGGFGKAGISKFLARRGVIGPTAEMATQLAGEAEAAVKTGIRESLWIPGEAGKVEDGVKFLTPEMMAAEAAPKIKAETMLTRAGEVWKPFTPEQTAARITKIEKLADAEPAVAVPMEDALQLPRTQALTYDFQAVREAALRTGAADVQRAMEESQNSLTWALREQTQTAPRRVPIGDNGISMAEAARAFRNHEGYVVGGWGGAPTEFHYYDAVDDVVNRLGGFEPIRIGAKPLEAARPARLAVTQAAEAALTKDKTLPLDLKLSRGLSLRSSQKTWDGLTRAERATVLGRAGEDTALAVKRWAKLEPAARANAVKEMKNIATGGMREAPTIITPAEVAAGDALTEQGLAALFEQVDLAKKARPVLAKAYHVERASRAGHIRSIGGQQLGEAAIGAKKAALKGELAPGLKPITGMTQAHKDAIINAIDRSEKLLDYEKANLQIALQAQWEGHKFLTPAQVEYASRAFGPEAAAKLSNMPKDGAMLHALKIAGSVPSEGGRGLMTVLTAYDASASLRQGIIFSVSHPLLSAKAFWRQARAAFSQKAFEALDGMMKAHPNFELYTKEGGLKIRELAGTAGPGGQAEQFSGAISRFLEKYIPGIKQSERGFITFLNQQRFEVLDSWYGAYASKSDVPIEQLKGYARWCNWAAGEGPLPEGGAKALSALMWAPKLASSRFVAPFAFLTTNGAARRAILVDQFKFVGGVVSFLAMAKMSGVADVELDPRSTDFGKMRIGNTRLDITGGEAMLMRTLVQGIRGQRKEVGGAIYDVNRWVVGGRFFQSKLQPGVGLLFDLSQGHTFIGDELTMTGASLKAQAWNRLVPLAIQDTVDAVHQWGAPGLLFGVTSFLGIGTQTYSNPWTTLTESKDKAAQAQGFKNFADMATKTETGVGMNLANARVSKDPEVIAAQARVDAYRNAHGGFTPMAEMGMYFTEQQAQDDIDLTTGAITGQQWRERRNARADATVVGYQIAIQSNATLKERYAKESAKLGDPFALPKGASVDTMTAAYFKVFEQYRNPTTGLIDDEGWEALNADIDKFRAQFTPEQLEKLDANIGADDTDIEKWYKGSRQLIEESGWWAVGDNAWPPQPQMVADALSTKTKPLTAADVAALVAAGTNFKDVDAYASAIFQRAFQQTGSRVAAAETLANDPLLAAIGTIISDARKGIAQTNPKAAELAISWGYVTNPNLELLARALAAEGMTIGDVNRQLLAAGLTPIGTAEEKKAAMKEGVPPPVAPAPAAPAPAAPTSAIGVPPVLKPLTATQAAPATPVEAPAPAPEATDGATGSTGATTGTPIAMSPAVAPAPTQEKPAVGSYEAIVSRLQGEPAYPKADVISTARVISDIGGFSLADIAPGLPPDQLKAKLAKDKPSWASWISDETWQTVGALGLTGKSTLLQVFWEMYGSAANSTLAKTVIKNEDVKRLLDNLSTMGSATVEMYMRAFEGMTRIFNEAVTGAQEDESKALTKAITSQEKKAASKAKSEAKKAASAAEKEAETAAEKLRWERMAEELAS